MRRAITIQHELAQIHTIEDLTEAFEGIASMHIARTRNRVVASKEFFAELWPTYRSLRIDPKERVKSTRRVKKGKTVLLVITSEGRLGGEVDEKIIDQLLQAYTDPKNADIMVIGTRGARRLKARGIPFVKAFTLPASDININASSVIRELDQYEQIIVFYQTYESLRVQKVVKIELLSAVRELGQEVGNEGEVISSRDYIFEPNINEIADYMESVMMGVALLQVLMESKLAGYASRFNAMNRAKHRASELVGDYRRQYYRAKRVEGDERLKEIMKVAKLRNNMGTRI